MGHHTKKHRKRTSRRGKYQKISPKKTRRRRQTKRRGGACCGSKPSNRRRKSSTQNASAKSRSSGKGKKRNVEDIYNEAKGPLRRKENNWKTLTADKKLEFIGNQLKCDPLSDLEILEAAREELEAEAVEEELKAGTAPAGRIDM